MKRFVLVATLFVLGRPDHCHVIDQLLVLVILHAESTYTYNSITRGFPDLNSPMNESRSSRHPTDKFGCYSISFRPLFDCVRNWLKREAKLNMAPPKYKYA